MDVQIAEASDISGIVECVTELPEPAASLADKIYQLIAVQPPYVMGRFYKCIHSSRKYLWRDVSEVQELVRIQELVGGASSREFFRLNGNEVQFRWDTPEEDRTFIKTEIQLVHLDTTGTVKSVKTIFTASSECSYPNGASVIVDDYTAGGIVQGKIKLRALSTFVGLVLTFDLPKVS